MISKKTAIFIQARTNSTRLPKKILMKIESKPMIWHVINRVKKSKIKKIFLLTTTKREDKKLKKICDESDIEFFSGENENVLNRFYECAKENNIDVIIRITGDCPLIDYTIIDKIYQIFLKNNFDYVSNTIKPTFPDGLDVEVFSFHALKKSRDEAKAKSEKEHVTSHIWKNPDKFKIYNFENSKNLSKLRWTVDEKEDIKVVRKIFQNMRPSLNFTTKQILKLIDKNPEIQKINSKIKRNEGYKKSIKND